MYSEVFVIKNTWLSLDYCTPESYEYWRSIILKHNHRLIIHVPFSRTSVLMKNNYTLLTRHYQWSEVIVLSRHLNIFIFSPGEIMAAFAKAVWYKPNEFTPANCLNNSCFLVQWTKIATYGISITLLNLMVTVTTYIKSKTCRPENQPSC